MLPSSRSTGGATTSATVEPKFRSSQSWGRNYIFTTIISNRAETSGRVVCFILVNNKHYRCASAVKNYNFPAPPRCPPKPIVCGLKEERPLHAANRDQRGSHCAASSCQSPKGCPITSNRMRLMQTPHVGARSATKRCHTD